MSHLARMQTLTLPLISMSAPTVKVTFKTLSQKDIHVMLNIMTIRDPIVTVTESDNDSQKTIAKHSDYMLKTR